jgi:hypothetical protein
MAFGLRLTQPGRIMQPHSFHTSGRKRLQSKPRSWDRLPTLRDLAAAGALTNLLRYDSISD